MNTPDPASTSDSVTASGVIVLARPKFGVVGETRRVCHVFPLPAAAPVPEWLTAYCGAVFTPGELDRFDEPRGMPCEICLARIPAARARIPESTGRQQFIG